MREGLAMMLQLVEVQRINFNMNIMIIYYPQHKFKGNGIGVWFIAITNMLNQLKPQVGST